MNIPEAVKSSDVPQFKRDDPKLGTIMEEGISGNVVLIGFPFDEGVLRNGGRRGSELGPDCLRRFIPKIGPIVNSELEISLASLRISDYGNIEAGTFEACHEKLRQKVLTVLKKPHMPVPFVLGGGNDQSWSNGMAFLDYCAENEYQPIIINIDAHLDVRPLDDQGRVHSGCPFRLLVEDARFQLLKGKLLEFACQGSQCASAHVQFVEEHRGHLFWLRDLRRQRVGDIENVRGPFTQAGKAMRDIFWNLKPSQRVFFSFDVDSISSSHCPGVSCPSVDGGLTAEEAVELGFLAGQTPQVALVDLSEYNPAVEDYRTGRLLSNIFYYFCLGYTLRNEERELFSI
jgi:formiminoglutamase